MLLESLHRTFESKSEKQFIYKIAPVVVEAIKSGNISELLLEDVGLRDEDLDLITATVPDKSQIKKLSFGRNITQQAICLLAIPA